MIWALYAIAGLITIGSLLTIGSVGKPRKPITPGTAALVVALSATEIVIICLAAGRLG